MLEDRLSDNEWMAEAHHQYASVYGEDRTEQAWVLSPYDVWVRNPHYHGEPQPHPESYEIDWDDESSF